MLNISFYVNNYIKKKVYKFYTVNRKNEKKNPTMKHKMHHFPKI